MASCSYARRVLSEAWRLQLARELEECGESEKAKQEPGSSCEKMLESTEFLSCGLTDSPLQRNSDRIDWTPFRS